MAEPFQQGGRWCFRYRDPATGKREFKTTDARTKGEAREVMGAFLVRLERQHVGLEVADPNPTGLTVAKLLRWWLKEFSTKLAGHESNEASIEKHFLHDALGELRLEEVTQAHVERYLHRKAKEKSEKRDGETMAPQTVNHLRSFLSRAFNKAKKHAVFLGPSPVVGVEKLPVDEPLPVFLEKREVRKVLIVAAEAQPQWVNLYAAAFYTGLRKGELFALTWDDVDFENALLTVRRSHSRKTTKGRRARVVDIPDELGPYLREQERLVTRTVFPNPEGGMWHRHTRIDLRFGEALRLAGIERHLRFHDTRDTFASLFLMSGGDIVALQELLGHRSIETTRRRYGHLSRDYVRAQMKPFSMAERKAPAPKRRASASKKPRVDSQDSGSPMDRKRAAHE